MRGPPQIFYEGSPSFCLESKQAGSCECLEIGGMMGHGSSFLCSRHLHKGTRVFVSTAKVPRSVHHCCALSSRSKASWATRVCLSAGCRVVECWISVFRLIQSPWGTVAPVSTQTTAETQERSCSRLQVRLYSTLLL